MSKSGGAASTSGAKKRGSTRNRAAGANAGRTTGFREIAQKATSAETLRSFLTEYRKRYPDSAVPERAGRDGETRADAEGGPATPPG